MKTLASKEDHIFIYISDRIIESLKTALNVRYEIYEKWYALKASNGVLLAISDTKGIACYFFKPENIDLNSINNIKFVFDDMVVVLIGENLDEIELKNVVSESHYRATQNYASGFSKVGLLHASLVLAADTDDNNAFSDCAIKLARLVNATDFKVSPPIRFQDNYSIDVDLLFSTPPSTKELTSTLRGIFPSLDEIQFGIGNIVVNHDGLSCKYPEIKWIHFYCRHH